MLGMQLAACFASWIGCGLLLRRRVGPLAEYWRGMNPARRTAYAAGMLIAGLFVLVGGLTLVASQSWLAPNGLTAPGFITVLVSGLGFTALQVMAALGLAVSVLPRSRETSPRPETSEASED